MDPTRVTPDRDAGAIWLKNCSDIAGTAIQYLAINFHPANVFSFTSRSTSYLQCSCHNSWIEPEVPECNDVDIADNCDHPAAVIKEYDFDFDVTTVNHARVGSKQTRD